MKCQIVTLFTIFAVCIADVRQNGSAIKAEVEVSTVSKITIGPDSSSTTQPSSMPSSSPITVPVKPTTLNPTTTSTIPTTPLTTTSTTSTTQSTTTTKATSTTASSSTTPKSSTVTSTSSTTPTKITTQAPATSTVIPPPSPRKFDGPSFVGGIVLASGLVAIGFVAFKFYKARTELNYHTL